MCKNAQKWGIIMNKNETTLKLTQAALLAALCYIGFQFLRIDLPLPTGKTAIHFGNCFCVLGALLIGGLYGGLAGAMGMTIADFTSGYAASAPKTFILKLCIGLIVGFIAHNTGKISESTDKAHVMRWSIIASVGGMAFNVIFDPVVSYLYKRYILGVAAEAASILAKWTAASTFINAVTSVIIAVVVFNVLMPALKKSELLVKI